MSARVRSATATGGLAPLRRVITEPANPLLRATGSILAQLMRMCTKRQWSHLERVPRTGGVIVVANHISNADPIALSHFLVYAGRWPHFLGKASLFALPVIGPILKGCGQIPVERGTRDAAGSLAAAVAAVQDGRCVVVYPEGTISRDPALWPMRGKTGAARIALATGAPVIPVAQWGAQQILWGRTLGVPRLLPRKTMILNAGDPIPLHHLRSQPLSADTLKQATETIMTTLTDMVAELRREAPPPIRFEMAEDGRR
ncbi:MAG: lysophospholipid acyltransferase family protein [Propionibacteriaceae bacterium]